MTEGMRQHRAIVLTCLLARAKRKAAQEVMSARVHPARNE